jgi:POT family proton-dependent oligopeptide transporter
VLFTTEMWERFSYFGNAAIVVLYMVKYLLEPGRIETVIGFGAVKATLEFLFGRLEPQPLASQLFGFYTGLAYFTPILGGLIADRLLGQRRTVLIGGVLGKANFFLMIAVIAALAGAVIGASSRGLRSMLEGPVSASTDRSA